MMMDGFAQHFPYEQLIVTEHREIDNTPPAALVPAGRVLSFGLERARHECGDEPIFVRNGYRCPALNAAVGGVLDSDHMRFLAGDLQHSRLAVQDFFLWLYAARHNIGYRQLILEFGAWCHLAFWMDGAGQTQKPPYDTLIINSKEEGYIIYREGMKL